MTTLVNGIALLDEMIAGQGHGRDVDSGREVSACTTRTGFPLDLTQDVARETGMDGRRGRLPGRACGQKERGRASAHFAAQGTGMRQVYLDLLRDLKADGTIAPGGRPPALV
jgi:alanyl-tRNA synthetase